MIKSKDGGEQGGSLENYTFGQWTGMGLCVLLTFLGVAAVLYASAPACRMPSKALSAFVR